jgi:lantibiotic modifying enzyme
MQYHSMKFTFLTYIESLEHRLSHQSLSALESKEIRANIAAAGQATRNALLEAPDHLCCGVMGRIELLSPMARATGDGELMNFAPGVTGRVLDDARSRGHYSLFRDPSAGMRSVGFFQGLPGIGDELLRLVQPESIPSVLLFE